MRDKYTRERVQLLHPKVRAEVATCIDAAEATLNCNVRIVQGFRTIEEQDAIYAQGRTKPGQIVTKAKGGHSYHNYGLAIDFALIYNSIQLSWDTAKDGDHDGIADWLEVIKQFKLAGWKWGATWGDNPHLEKSFGHTVADLLSRYRAHNFEPGSKYVAL